MFLASSYNQQIQCNIINWYRPSVIAFHGIVFSLSPFMVEDPLMCPMPFTDIGVM